jgi:nicotinamidase-related amidase
VRFENQPDSPFAQLLDWHGCSEPPETDIAPELGRFVTPGRVFAKPGQAGLPDSLASRLQQMEIKRVTVVGLDTDMCVLKVAMDLFDLGIEPILLTACFASTSGLQAHLAGLAVLSRNIGARRLREAGLSESYLAAPPR